MRSLPGGMRRRRGSALTLAVAAGSLACLGLGCAPEFDGPYPCADGYASCTNTEANTCETDITSDALNCGSCGMACGVGAACTASACGAPAVQLTTLSKPANDESTLGVNSTAVFWSGTEGGQNGVFSVPIGGIGGSPTTAVATDLACQSAQAFAVDDDNLYYWAAADNTGFDQGGSGNGPTSGGLTELPLAGGTSTLLVSSGNGGISGTCPLTAVDATNVYWLMQGTGMQDSMAVADVPIAPGGTSNTLSTASNYDPTQLVITPTSAVVEVQSTSGPNSYAAIPIAGGPPIQVSPGGNSQGGSAFTADAANIYVVGSSCPCNDDGSPYTGRPTGQVVMVPIGGGPSTTLANFTGQASSIVLDSGNVYWSTDTDVWKVSTAGGPVSSVAGNLASASTVAGAAAGYQCTSCGGSSPGLTTLIAVGGASVYIADFPSSVSTVGAILAVPK